MTRTFFSGVALGVLAIIVVVGMVAFSRSISSWTTPLGGYFPFGGPKTFTGADAKLPVENPKQLNQHVAAVGQSVTAGDAKWTITDLYQTNGLKKYSFPPSTQQGAFLVVHFKVKNVSDLPVTLTPDSIGLRSKEGRENYAQANVNSGYVKPEKNIIFTEKSLIQPGATVEGVVNFDLGIPFGIHKPTDLSNFRLTFNNTDPTVKAKDLTKYIKL